MAELIGGAVWAFIWALMIYAFLSREWGITSGETKPVVPPGVCKLCLGRGRYDNPPWGIVKCEECEGTGKS